MNKTRTLGLGLLAAAPAFALMEPATPESQGISSEAILKWIDATEKAFDGVHEGSMHGFVIVRHGKTVAEGSWKPFDTLNETHMLYSHSKSFTSSAIGFLADEGKIDLDERIVDLFSNEVPAQVSKNLSELRVRDLLTMNVGKKDHLLRDGGDWVKEFLSKDFVRKPGTGFKYDSDATYMLAAIVEKKSGEKMMDYLKRKMFDKIGITKAWTTCSPQGIPCGGWGMNMTTRELARFGQLYLNRGKWGDEYVLSPFWVDLATCRHTWSGWQNVGVKALGEGTDWEQGYGFQFWRCTHGAYRADGAAGQYTVVMPEQDAVISIHASLNNLQLVLTHIWDYLLPEMKPTALPENAAAQAALKARLAKLEISPVKSATSLGADFQKKFELKENKRGFKSVAFEHVNVEGKTRVRCRIVTRMGEQSFLAGYGEWVRGGKIRIEPETYERLGGYIGEFDVSASCGNGPVFHLRAYMTGATSYLDFTVDRTGKLKGVFGAMGGVDLESK